jgi:3-oxoacyl-(acyl-carrier-protein) synthase III
MGDVCSRKDHEQRRPHEKSWIPAMNGSSRGPGFRNGELPARIKPRPPWQLKQLYMPWKVASLKPSDLDLIIVATSSPEHIFPATACIVQDRLGAVKAGAFDLLAACTGFIFALNMASQAIRSGSIDNALVIGAETLSRIVNWQDRETCILFGDGAGAFVLQASQEPGGQLSSVMRSDGSGGDYLSLPAGAVATRPTRKR